MNRMMRAQSRNMTVVTKRMRAIKKRRNLKKLISNVKGTTRVRLALRERIHSVINSLKNAHNLL